MSSRKSHATLRYTSLRASIFLGCLLLERRLPERVRRTPKPEAVTMTPITPPLDLAPERL